MTRKEYIIQATIHTLPTIITKIKCKPVASDQVEIALMYAETAADILINNGYLDNDPEELPSRLNNNQPKTM